MRKLASITLVILVMGILMIFVSPAYGCISGNCENGQGTKTYANGRKYVGEYKDGLPHGRTPIVIGVFVRLIKEINDFE